MSALVVNYACCCLCLRVYAVAFTSLSLLVSPSSSLFVCLSVPLCLSLPRSLPLSPPLSACRPICPSLARAHSCLSRSSFASFSPPEAPRWVLNLYQGSAQSAHTVSLRTGRTCRAMAAKVWTVSFHVFQAMAFKHVGPVVTLGW